MKSPCNAFASRLAQLSQLISGDSYRSIPMKSPLNAIPISTPALLQRIPASSKVVGTDEDRPVRFSAAGEIFPARNLFDGLPVHPENRQLLFAIAAEMVVQSLL